MPDNRPVVPPQAAANLPEHPTLTDNHGRAITYLRLAITDRCNLRCRYCMPQEKVSFVSHAEIMRYEEMTRLVRIFARLGISKVRVTGGEPFARRDCLPFLEKIKHVPGIKDLYVTTNGLAVARHLGALQEIGISGINLSLDTLDPDRFYHLTGSKHLDLVLATLDGAVERNIPIKINCVVFEETTDQDMYAVAGLARQLPLTVRYIEKMPFSGGNNLKNGKSDQLRKRLHALFPKLRLIPSDRPSTALVFAHEDFTGRIGLIEGHSRKFCTTCNKIRVTPLGMLKTCLYDNGSLDLRAMIRSGADDATLSRAILDSVNRRYPNGREAEKSCAQASEPSMASIGG